MNDNPRNIKMLSCTRPPLKDVSLPKSDPHVQCIGVGVRYLITMENTFVLKRKKNLSSQPPFYLVGQLWPN